MHASESPCLSMAESSTTEQLLAASLEPFARLLAAGGFTRPDVERALARAFEGIPIDGSRSPRLNLGLQLHDCIELMCIWRRDTAFLDADGLPAALGLDPNGMPTFEQLCKAAQVRTSAADLLETLRHFEAICFVGDSKILPRTPTFIIGASRRGRSLALDGILKLLAGFLRTIEHNVSMKKNGWRPRFERACTVPIAEELVPVFERRVAERAQEFVDGLDEWLERNRLRTSISGRYREVGVGAYFVDMGAVSTSINQMNNKLL